MISALLLQAAAAGLGKLGAGVGAGLAAIGAGIGIGRIGGNAGGYQQDLHQYDCCCRSD